MADTRAVQGDIADRVQAYSLLCRSGARPGEDCSCADEEDPTPKTVKAALLVLLLTVGEAVALRSMQP